MPEFLHLRPGDARRVPWKNGRGVTEELAVWPPEASFERGGKVWYRKGSDIPESKYEDIVDMSFLDAAQAKYK